MSTIAPINFQNGAVILCAEVGNDKELSLDVQIEDADGNVVSGNTINVQAIDSTNDVVNNLWGQTFWSTSGTYQITYSVPTSPEVSLWSSSYASSTQLINL